jgi:hypothetical protein
MSESIGGFRYVELRQQLRGNTTRHVLNLELQEEKRLVGSRYVNSGVNHSEHKWRPEINRNKELSTLGSHKVASS